MSERASPQADPPQIARPFLLRLGGIFAVLYAVGASVLLAAAAAGLTPYLIDGQPVTREEWLALAVPLFTVMVVLMAVIAFGIFTERAWARPLVMVHWATVAIYGLVLLLTGQVNRAVATRVMAEAGTAGVFAAWYFYWKPNVVAYFQRLHRGSRTRKSAP